MFVFGRTILITETRFHVVLLDGEYFVSRCAPQIASYSWSEFAEDIFKGLRPPERYKFVRNRVTLRELLVLLLYVWMSLRRLLGSSSGFLFSITIWLGTHESDVLPRDVFFPLKCIATNWKERSTDYCFFFFFNFHSFTCWVFFFKNIAR